MAVGPSLIEVAIGYVLLLPLAHMAARDMWWGSDHRLKRIAMTLAWPVAVVVLWFLLAFLVFVVFPSSLLRKAIIAVFRPLHARGKLSPRATNAVNAVLRRLPS
jgi:hypothetical protein